jgi:hypothetical protein
MLDGFLFGLVGLTDPAFELQLVRRGIPPKALKRRNTMVKVTSRNASKDDPIFRDGFVISSKNKAGGSMRSTPTSHPSTDGKLAEPTSKSSKGSDKIT